MKMDVIYEKIKPNRRIEIPEEMMKRLGLKVGEEIELRVVDRKVLIRPSRSIVDELTGIIKVDPKIVDEVVENEDFYEF